MFTKNDIHRKSKKWIRQNSISKRYFKKMEFAGRVTKSRYSIILELAQRNLQKMEFGKVGMKRNSILYQVSFKKI